MSNISPLLIGSTLSALLIVLSFVALLAQKVYIRDKDSTQSAEVELPFLGKMKTNYPALVIAFLGVGLAVYSLKLGSEAKSEPWEIDVTPVSAAANDTWQDMLLVVFPRELDDELDAHTGKHTLRLSIDAHKTFEDVVERIQLSHKLGGSATILTKEELERKKNGQPSVLKSSSNRTRSYVVSLGAFPPN